MATLNVNAQGLTTSQEKQLKEVLNLVNKITTAIKDQQGQVSKLQIGYNNISDSLTDYVAELYKAGRTQKEIEQFLEIRLNNEYRLADAQKKHDMEKVARDRQIAQSREQADLALSQIAEHQLALQEDLDEISREYHTSELAAAQQIYRISSENIKALTNQQAEQEYYLQGIKENNLKSFQKRQEDFNKASLLRDQMAIKRKEAAELASKDKLSKEERKRLNKLQRDLQSDVSQLESLESDKVQDKTTQPKKIGSVFGANIISQNGGVWNDIKTILANGFKQLTSTFYSSIDNAVKTVSEWQAKTNYRLEGAGKTWDDIFELTSSNLGISVLARQQNVLERIGKAVDQGIAYNVEQRAFLAEVSDKIQGTFDAFDSNLLRLIRIQSADSTAARLGMEKALNDMLTAYYADSSYLNDLYDSVSQALFEMSAFQSREQAVDTEFIIQKWLGSLYSTGASQSAIQQLATGLGYLGSGNVEALSSNQGLQTLLALSASRAGKDYATMLTDGLNASDVNDLLKAMIDYLAEIADSTAQNKVVTSAYGNIFGLSVSDIKSFANLSELSDTIYNESLSYTQALANTQTQLVNMQNRLGTAEMMQTAFDNAMFSMGMQYANGIGYMVYKAVDIVDKLSNGGPEIDVSPWGIGTSFKVFDIIKAGMFGAGLIGALVNGAGSEGIYGGTDLSAWGAEDYRTLGSGFKLSEESGTSYSATYGSASSKDVEEQSLTEGVEKSEEIQSKAGADKKDIYKALIREGDTELVSNIKVRQDEISQSVLKAIDIMNEISSSSSKKSVNVNLQRINGSDLQGNYILTSPNNDWQKLMLQAAYLIKFGEQLSGFGGQLVRNQIDAQSDETGERTLQEMINLLVPMLESDTGLPVRLESVDSMTNLISDLSRR